MKFKLLPFNEDENVPIPDVLPIDKNGYWVVNVSVSSCTTKTWCNALVEPLDTLTILLKLDTSSYKNEDTVVATDTFAKFDSNLTVLSEPSICPEDLNLYVLIPAAVVPIPMIDDLTDISFNSSFSKLTENISVDIPDVKSPIKFEVNDSSVSVINSDRKVFVPSWAAYNWTKFVSLVVGSFTSTDAKNASILFIFPDIISDDDPEDTILLLPTKLMKPTDWVPIPAKSVLNVFWKIFKS